MVENKVRQLFGTDGMRGRANEGAMSAEVALQLGRAVGYLLHQRGGQIGRARPQVVIGKDTRVSGYLIENALVAGLCSAGIDVYLAGPLPTPGVALLTQSRRADAGLMISASHNPFEDNGVKIFARDGYKLPDEEEMMIESLMHGEGCTSFDDSILGRIHPHHWHGSAQLNQHRPIGENIGRAARISDAIGRYNVMAKQALPRSVSLSGLKVVIDCANGAAYRVAPQVLQELGAEVIPMAVEPNGININDHCGATHTASLIEKVGAENAHLGIALDGDADRCILVDERQQVLDGDQVLAVLGRSMKNNGTLKANRVVTTVMSNLGLEKSLERCDVGVERVQVGDRYVVAKMREINANLGGEQSGHTILRDIATTGDGLVTALSMLGVMVQEEKSLSQLGAEMQHFPQALKSFIVAAKPSLTSLPKTQNAISKVESMLHGKGRVLVRYSGTQQMARVMVEGEDTQVVEGLVEEISELMATEINELARG
jgi:phosphoglucosamine mutase